VGQRDLSGSDIEELRSVYTEKVNSKLPEEAKKQGNWPVDEDHCFGRIVLDNLFEDVWYRHIEERPAYMNLSRQELKEAVGIADRMLSKGREEVEVLNQKSLSYREETR
jgi:hypothetical protein